MYCCLALVAHRTHEENWTNLLLHIIIIRNELKKEPDEGDPQVDELDVLDRIRRLLHGQIGLLAIQLRLVNVVCLNNPILCSSRP